MNGHRSTVAAVVHLSDGRIVSASWDEYLKIWDPISGRCLSTLRGHSSSVNALIALDDGCLASGGDDDTIVIWYQMRSVEI